MLCFARSRQVIAADVPHRKFLATKAKRLLGWEARHRFEHLWTREES